MKELYCKAVGFLTCMQCPLLLLFRLYWGWSFVQAGWGKFGHIERTVGFFTEMGIPFATANVYFVASVETLGGLLLILGLASRVASLFLAATMVVALLTAHLDGFKQIFSDSSQFLSQAPVTYLMVTLIVLTFGAGGLSMDAFLCKQKACAKPNEKK